MATAAKKKDVRPTSMNLSREQLSNVNFKNVSAHSIEADIVAAEYWKADNYGSRRNQYVCALIASLGSVCMGCCLGWSSPALPYLEGEGNSKFAITKEESSWIGSLLTLGAVVGALPTGYMVDTIGRKLVQIIISILYILSWVILLAIEESLLALYFSRLISGFAMGAVTVALPIYNEEIAEVDIRGRIGSFLDLMMAVGILYIYFMGALVPYTWLNVSGLVVSGFFLITIVWMPESPMYLIGKSNFNQAEKALNWLRNVDVEDRHHVVKEMMDMQQFLVTHTVRTDIKKPNICKRFYEYLRIKSPKARIVRIIFSLMALQQLCGIYAVTFYLHEILSASGSDRSAWIGMIVFAIMETIATIVAAGMVEHVGKRWLLLVSLTGLMISLIVLCIHDSFYNHNDSPVPMLPIITVAVYAVSFSVGIGPLPWVIMAEFLTVDLKRNVSSTAVSFNWAVGFGVTKTFLLLKESVGTAWPYGIYCLICILGIIYVVFCVPETKGKSRIQILIEMKMTTKGAESVGRSSWSSLQRTRRT